MARNLWKRSRGGARGTRKDRKVKRKRRRHLIGQGGFYGRPAPQPKKQRRKKR